MLQILPDLTLLIQIALFLLFIWAMNALLFKPALAVLEERDTQIAGAREQATRLEARVSEAVKNYEARLREARIAGEKERARFVQEAAEEEQRIATDGRAQAAAATEKIRAEISQGAAAAQRELGNRSREFAALIAERALGRRMA